ncbi:MAG: transcription termination/antitermination protein NusA [Christensenellaceae bacterium]|nr:transcription termination/antitermination protein NusA [Christensenellaceae bacterium]
MSSDFLNALAELEREKGIDKSVLIDAIETALVSAYKKNYGTAQDVRVEVDPDSGVFKVYAKKTVVETVRDDTTEISLKDAQKINIAYEPGDVVELEVTPSSFGRIAAQTAKQVVVHRLREAERNVIYDKFIEREGEVMTGIIHRVDKGSVLLEIDGVECIMPAAECIPGERYNVNDRIKVYIMEVRKTTKGPQVIVSRTHPYLLKRLFEIEVPEIMQNIVHIKSIAREAGSRTKIAVHSDDENVDPVGSCVGQKGSRIDRVVAELGNEKIDVIPWSPDPIEFIANALRPAKVLMVQINESEKAAKVVVPDYQLSLAIGREGQNARLAAKLTGWKIDIKSQSQVEAALFDNQDETKDNDFDSFDFDMMDMDNGYDNGYIDSMDDFAIDNGSEANSDS